MSYYGEGSQWQPSGPQGQPSGWDHQTPPIRSGASSVAPREEAGAFGSQFEEIDRAMENLLKSGKMFPMGNRRGRGGPGAGPRQHQMSNDFGSDARGGPHSNLQSFYATQRHQSSRGSNEAEQAMQAKRRMAAQRERELRNYHQEQQYNRTMLAELSSFGGKNDRALSPGNMSEDDRRELIARQRSALYGEGPFAESGGYVDETGATRPGIPGPPHGPPGVRRHSPLGYDFGRTPPAEGSQAAGEGGPGTQSAGQTQRSRANSTSSPQSNTAARGVFDSAQQASRTSTSSPSEGAGKPGPAPIGTRPGPSTNAAGQAVNPALNKRETTPGLPSPLSRGQGNENVTPTSGAPGQGSGSGDMWGSRGGVWGNSSKSGLGVQASVWG